jgi:hypothetical protein
MARATQPHAERERRGHDPLAPVRALLREALEAHRKRVFAELRGYPPPITGCDVQFNHLLAERERVAEELGRLEALEGHGAVPEASRAALAGFVAASACLDDAARRELQAALREGAPPAAPPDSSPRERGGEEAS